jgi:hypothetical protein
MTLISVVSAVSAAASRRAPESRSALRIRPPGPEPATRARSIPASRARRRFAGEVITRPWRIGATALAATAGTTAATVCAAVSTVLGGTGRNAGAGAGAAGTALPLPSVNSNTISGEPTAILSPGAPVTDTTRPLTGAGTSTAALSVITSTMS